MLKRLLFAVFVMGLVFTLSGTAISDIGEKPVEGLNPIPTVNPNAQLYNDIADARPEQPSFKKPESALREVQMSGVAPTPPSAYFCDFDYYYDDTATSVYVWTIPDAYGDDLFNMRFTVDAGLECTLKVGWILMYGGYMEGTPDMRIYLWDDYMGFPGNKLDSADVLYANLPASFGWAFADWSAAEWVFAEGEEYHIGWTVLGGPSDVLCCVSDKATGPHVGEERASENYAGFWGSMLNDWGVDVGFMMESERCCYETAFSDCYSQSWDEGTAYYWQSPHPSYNIFDYAQRFTAVGKDTLASVDICVYNMGTTPPKVSGNGNLIIQVWDDNGFGYPGSVVATEIVPAGTYPFYPTYTSVDFYSHGLVFHGEDFFVSFNSDETVGIDCEATLSDDETTPHGRSYCNYGGWSTIAGVFGVDVDMKYTANLCRDPFWDCSLNFYNLGPLYYWTLPDAYGDVADAQKIKAVGQDCIVGEVSWALYNWGSPTGYSNDSKVSVYSDVAGLPGTELASIILTPAEYQFFPSYTTVDFEPLDVHVTGYYWIAIESFAATEADGIATLTDFGGGPMFNGAAELWNGLWGLLCVDWGGVPCDIAFDARSYHCCWPYDERYCGDPVGGEDWFTHQHDQARTGASFNEFSDAQCDLTVQWSYMHPANGIKFTGPAISGDKIACVFDNQVQVFDLATGGAPLYTLGSPLGGNIRSTPLIHNGVIYVSGGDAQSITAWNFATGALIWNRDYGTVGSGGLFGETKYCNFIILDQGGTDILYWGTDGGSIVAAEAANGRLYAGWGDTTVAGNNPIDVTFPVLKSGATDGTNLYYCTYPGSYDGDVYSINAATGGPFNWQLSVPPGGGLQANTVYPQGPQLAEGFPSGCSYENGVLYVNSRIAGSYHPGDGVFYAINTIDGSLKYAVASIAPSGTAGPTPVIDQSMVYVLGLSRWVTPPLGAHVFGYHKSTGALLWSYDSPEGDGYYGDAALTCEPEGVPDKLFVAGTEGFISYLTTEVDAVDREVFRRRLMYGGFPASLGLSFAIAPGYIAMSDYYGSLTVLAKGDDRPRLEIQSYQPTLPVEFGPLTSLEVPIPGLLVNTGCVDLTINNITTDLNSTHPWIPAFAPIAVRQDVMNLASSISDNLTETFSSKSSMRVNEQDLDEYFVLRDRGEQMMNLGATVQVPFLQYGTHTDAVVSPADLDVLPAGETVDVVLDVNQSMVVRGPQDFYMVFDTDDPDFFLSGAFFGPPEIHVTIVGGCLTDTTYLPFGMGAANYQTVYNHGRIATGDWGAAMDIDGADGAVYQGSYIYATGIYEQAINTHAWHGQGPAYAYWSLQADPNWCDNECKPNLDEDVDLFCTPGYTDDGFAYVEIIGNRVCKSYIDSVQNFDDGSGWDWENFGAPFDSVLTMGLYVNSRTVGAVGFDLLADLTVEIFEVTERNGDPVAGWKFASTIDWDMSGSYVDIMHMDADASAGFGTGYPHSDNPWGQIKLPYGCGDPVPNASMDPMINVVSMNPNQAWWADTYMGDVAWNLLNLPHGYHDLGVMDGTQPDMQGHMTLVEYDFEGGDTYEFAVATFGLAGATTPDYPEVSALSALANKWVGAGRGDVNDDGEIDLLDVMHLACYVNDPGLNPGPIPFMHLGDVNCDGAVDMADVLYLIAYLYTVDGPCPCFDWCF